MDGAVRSKKQSMAELKLRRLTELNVRLKEDLERRRIPVSEAAAEYVLTCHTRERDLPGVNQMWSLQSHRLHRQRTKRLYGTIPLGLGK